MSHHHEFTSLPRIFCPTILNVGTEVSLVQNIAHRLLQVLRLKIGDYLVIFNGDGKEYVAKLVAADKKSARILIEENRAGISESPLKIHLGQCIARGEKMDFIVQKAVELGVNEITPLFSEFCNVRLDGERSAKRVTHWQEVAIHAAEQCGRCVAPKINQTQDLELWAEQVQADTKLVLSPTTDQNLYALMSTVFVTGKNGVTFLVGPEGGLSMPEILLAEQQGFVSAKLGPRILRTETAALVAISILQARLGDLM